MADCANMAPNVTSPSGGYISNGCALFDFTLYTVFSGSLCVMGCLGNALSFLVLWKDKGSHSATSFLLRALAAADTLVLLAAVPLYVLPAVYPHAGYLEEYYTVYVGIMPFLWPVYLVPFTGSVLLTVLVSFDRYFAVCRPLKYSDLLFRKRIRTLVLLVAIFSVVYNLPRFVEYEKVEICTAANKTQSIFQLSAFGHNILYRIIYANLLYFFLIHGGPLVSLSFFNFKLVQTLRTRERRRRVGLGKPGCAAAQGDVTLVLIVVIFVFIVCQTPTLVDHVLWTVVDEGERECGNWHYYYTAVGDALAILNSSVNFVVYVLTSQRFRRRLVGWFACGRKGRSAVFSLRYNNSETVAMATRLCRVKATSLAAEKMADDADKLDR